MNHLEVETEDEIQQTIGIDSIDELLEEEEHVKQVKDKLNKYQNYEDGWAEGGGVAPSSEAIKEAHDFLEDNRVIAKLLHVSALIDGGLLFEFYLADYDCAYEIDNDGRGRFYVI